MEQPLHKQVKFFVLKDTIEELEDCINAWLKKENPQITARNMTDATNGARSGVLYVMFEYIPKENGAHPNSRV